MRKLEIDMRLTQWGIYMQVISQTHRCLQFTPSGRSFRSSSGMAIFSVRNPDIELSGLCVRGEIPSRDDKQIVCGSIFPKKDWAKKVDEMMNAVKEYNEEYA